MSHPTFGPRSRRELATCDERLQRLAHCVIRAGMDFTVLQGHRSDAEQADLFARGLSKKRPGESKHNQSPSLAIDVAPWPIDWKHAKAFYHLAGLFRMAAFDLSIPLRWGGDWDMDFDLRDQTFMDLAHFEIV